MFNTQVTNAPICIFLVDIYTHWCRVRRRRRWGRLWMKRSSVVDVIIDWILAYLIVIYIVYTLYIENALAQGFLTILYKNYKNNKNRNNHWRQTTLHDVIEDMGMSHGLEICRSAHEWGSVPNNYLYLTLLLIERERTSSSSTLTQLFSKN